ncbi:MAG: class I SAM-dependent methyltransferase [Gaiellaceae bacterium]
MNLRTRLFLEIVCSHIPKPPARVLEVGCGKGDLARALAERGFDVTAIDPNAPDGPIFRKVRLEDLSDERGFDAVVASLSLHHVRDLGHALDTIASLLPEGGPLVLEEWAIERLAGPTVRWWYEQRRALASVGRGESAVPDDFEAWQRQTAEDRADLHPAATMLAALGRNFAERYLEWHPYLYSWLLDDTLHALEGALIEEGAIEATALWYVGERR